jgi:hypothetical protein
LLTSRNKFGAKLTFVNSRVTMKLKRLLATTMLDELHDARLEF